MSTKKTRTLSLIHCLIYTHSEIIGKYANFFAEFSAQIPTMRQNPFGIAIAIRGVVNANRPYAQVDSYEKSGVSFVVVYSPNPEGGYTCISHAPHSSVPRFTDHAKALDFCKSLGVASEDIEVRTHNTYANL